MPADRCSKTNKNHQQKQMKITNKTKQQWKRLIIKAKKYSFLHLLQLFTHKPIQSTHKQQLPILLCRDKNPPRKLKEQMNKRLLINLASGGLRICPGIFLSFGKMHVL